MIYIWMNKHIEGTIIKPTKENIHYYLRAELIVYLSEVKLYGINYDRSYLTAVRIGTLFDDDPNLKVALHKVLWEWQDKDLEDYRWGEVNEVSYYAMGRLYQRIQKVISEYYPDYIWDW